MAARKGDVDLKPIGECIRSAIRELRKKRQTVSAKERAEIDLTIRRLSRRYADIQDECKSWWR